MILLLAEMKTKFSALLNLYLIKCVSVVSDSCISTYITYFCYTFRQNVYVPEMTLISMECEEVKQQPLTKEVV